MHSFLTWLTTLLFGGGHAGEGDIGPGIDPHGLDIGPSIDPGG